MLEFNICKLTSLEYFKLPNRKVLVIVASASLKILLSISVIMLRRKWRRKWHVFSTSQPQVQSGVNVSLKVFLNLFMEVTKPKS